MEIKLFPTPQEVRDEDLHGSVAIVIDVLRASSTVMTALLNGAREIIPVATPAEAGELASKSGRGNALLCGERQGKKIEGFDLGNSPFEYTSEIVKDRTLIFASTNGSPTLVRARTADKVFMGCFNNFTAIVNCIQKENRPIAILCSATYDKFSIEDFVCGGKFIEVLDQRSHGKAKLNDAARAAGMLYQNFRGQLADMLRTSTHGKYLASLGFSEDLDYCAKVDSLPVIPIFSDGKIKGYRPDGEPLLEVITIPA